MPSYKTKQVDEQGKPIYQDVCYPVTKDFREKLYNEIISEYEKAKDKSNEKAVSYTHLEECCRADETQFPL